MTKNENMCKNGDCPKGWTIKQQSASLNLLCNVLHCIDRFALHLTILLSNKPRSNSRTGSQGT